MGDLTLLSVPYIIVCVVVCRLGPLLFLFIVPWK